MCLIGCGCLFALVQGFHICFGGHALRFRSGLSLKASRRRLRFGLHALVLCLDLRLDSLHFRLRARLDKLRAVTDPLEVGLVVYYGS